MPIDQAAAETFIWSAARLVDRRRYALLFADGPAQPVVDALRGYHNADGGFGHALEPDLRCPVSQPAATLQALETLREAGALNGEMARDARTWIASIAEPDGGIPFALPGFDEYPHAPWWTPEPGSFLTLALAAVLHSGGAADDEWLARATDWCWGAIEAAEKPNGYWLKYAVRSSTPCPTRRVRVGRSRRLRPASTRSQLRPRRAPRARRCVRLISRRIRAAARAGS